MFLSVIRVGCLTSVAIQGLNTHRTFSSHLLYANYFVLLAHERVNYSVLESIKYARGWLRQPTLFDSHMDYQT